MKDPAPELSAQRFKVCLIDDEDDIREMYTTGLVSEGFDVVSADNGEAGLALIRAEHPDVILLDLQMPVMDGFAVLRAIAEDKAISRIPVVILSNTDNEDSFRAAGEFNHDFFLSRH